MKKSSSGFKSIRFFNGCDMSYFINFMLKKVLYIFKQEMFGSAPIYNILKSCMRSSYTPWYKTEISRTGENRGKPCQVCKNQTDRPQS